MNEYLDILKCSIFTLLYLIFVGIFSLMVAIPTVVIADNFSLFYAIIIGLITFLFGFPLLRIILGKLEDWLL